MIDRSAGRSGYSSRDVCRAIKVCGRLTAGDGRIREIKAAGGSRTGRVGHTPTRVPFLFRRQVQNGFP